MRRPQHANITRSKNIEKTNFAYAIYGFIHHQEFLQIKYECQSLSGITSKQNQKNEITENESKIQFTHTIEESIFQKNLWINAMSDILQIPSHSNETTKKFQDKIIQYLKTATQEVRCLRFDEQLEYYNFINKKTKITILTTHDDATVLKSIEIPREYETQITTEAPNALKTNQSIKITPLAKEKEGQLLLESFPNWEVSFTFKEKTRERVNRGNISSWKISDFEMISSNGYEKRDHTILSYGQKRLISFAYYSACHPYIIIADELVNGMHHKWIADCMDLIKDRQSFLTSQNPLLLDHLTFNSVEDVQKTFILCQNVEGEGDERDEMRWGTMDTSEAERFFGSHEVNILHISEILKGQGLW